jgi:uncharacterized damage-inducible protein DinB
MTPEYCRTLARYNRWMNEKLYAVASELTDKERKSDRGAFFKSIHGTLNHLLLADSVWMARFTGASLQGDRLGPNGIRALDQELYSDFEELRRERTKTDGEFEFWVSVLTAERLTAPLRYKRRGVTYDHPLWWSVAHLMSHQTHHRGRVTRRSLCRRAATPASRTLSRCSANATGVSSVACSPDRVFDGLHGACPNAFARRLGRELLLLFRERVDALSRRTGRLLHDDELREAGQDEDAALLQLLVSDGHERLDDRLHVLAGDVLAVGVDDRLQDLTLRERLALLRGRGLRHGWWCSLERARKAQGGRHRQWARRLEGLKPLQTHEKHTRLTHKPTTPCNEQFLEFQARGALSTRRQ